MNARELKPLSLAVLVAFCQACAAPGTVVVVKLARQWAAPAVPVSVTSALPSAVPASTAPRASVVVRLGDCLWKLSRRFLGKGSLWPSLAEANRLRRPWLLRVGRRLVVPGGVALQRTKSDAPGDAARFGWNAVPNSAFTVGEKLTFAVQYAGLTAGYATLSIPAVVMRGGRPAFHIVAQATSLPFFDWFFRVRDLLDSYIDVDYAFSWGYEKHLSEGRFKADASYDYDQRRGLILEPAKGTQAPMPIGSQDVLSCYYYFRTQPLAVGMVVDMPVTADDMKDYRLTVTVLRQERVTTLAGDFDCFVVRPHLSFKGVFRQKGEVLLWITADQRRLPVLIRSKIAIGSIAINLQSAQWVEPPTERNE